MKYKTEELPLKRINPALFGLGNKVTSTTRNNAVKCMEENDNGALVYYYLLSKFLEKQSDSDVKYGSIAAFICFLALGGLTYIMIQDCKENSNNEAGPRLAYTLSFFLACFGTFLFYPLISYSRNQFQMNKETKEGCATWLNKKLAPNIVNKLEVLDYNQSGFFNVRNFLEINDIPEAKPENIPGPFL